MLRIVRLHQTFSKDFIIGISFPAEHELKCFEEATLDLFDFKMRHFSKCLLLCFTEERVTYRFTKLTNQ